METAERRVRRCVECRLDRIVGIVKAQARVWVRVWSRLQVRPEEALQGFAGVCVAGCFFRHGVVILRYWDLLREERVWEGEVCWRERKGTQ